MFRSMKRLSSRAASYIPPLSSLNLPRAMSSRPSPAQTPAQTAQNTITTTTTNSNFYQLPTLTSIRLLKIHTIIPVTPETKEHTILYTIHFFELATSPPFLALSYTWQSPIRSFLSSTKDDSPAPPSSTPGPRQDDHSVKGFLCHRPYTIGTKNLRDALVGLALAPGLELGGCWVWADAICIDQEDVAEKVVQVGMMGEIYERAEGVVVWLGPVTVPVPVLVAGGGESGVDAAAELESFLWLHGEFFNALGA